MRFLTVVMLVVALAGCVQRGALTLHQDAAQSPDASVQSILVATNRALGPGNVPTTQRTHDLSYAIYDISVPDDREAGSLQWPEPGQADPAAHFLTTRAGKFRDEEAFIQDIRGRLAALPPGDREITLFTHGYNMNFAEGVYRMAQMRQDYGFQTVPVFSSVLATSNRTTSGSSSNATSVRPSSVSSMRACS